MVLEGLVLRSNHKLQSSAARSGACTAQDLGEGPDGTFSRPLFCRFWLQTFDVIKAEIEIWRQFTRVLQQFIWGSCIFLHGSPALHEQRRVVFLQKCLPLLSRKMEAPGSGFIEIASSDEAARR